MKRLMGLDLGTKTIGVAVSDPLNIMAQPVETLKRKNLLQDIGHLKEIINQYDVGEIVIGLPLNMNGSPGSMSESVVSFQKKLALAVNLPVNVWDERLSTQAVQRLLIDADVSRQKRRKVVDKLAAVFILQGYMDCRKREKRYE